MKVRCWIEAMRLHTLPVSTAGVVMACGYAINEGVFQWLPAVLCFLFAVLAQITSNFANEYFDYVNGSDKKGREGFRRGVTEGDISPKAMKTATFGTLALACLIGCALIPYGGWEMIPVGIFIAIFALAYSAGPFPLSRIGLGDLAVLIFFGLVPVNFTYFLMAGEFSKAVLAGSFGIGLMGVNVLIVNNYRDMEDDKEAGKRTTVVIFGRRIAAIAYLIFGFLAAILTMPMWMKYDAFIIAPLLYLAMHYATWRKIIFSSGAALNPLLGATARNMLIYALLFLAMSFA